MPDLPTGTVTFLFTDDEGSTRLWEQHPDPMRAALVRRGAIGDAIRKPATGRRRGAVVRPRDTEDRCPAALAPAPDAVAAPEVHAAADGVRAVPEPCPAGCWRQLARPPVRSRTAHGVRPTRSAGA